MVEVRCNARLHDARHVSYWCKTAWASCEKRQNREAPPLSVQPGDYMSSEGLACRDTHSIQQGQSVAEQAAERHVPLLQTCLWRGKRGRNDTAGVIKKKSKLFFFFLFFLWLRRTAHQVGWMSQRPPELSPAESPGCWGWCCLLVPESPKTAHTSTHTLQPSVSPPARWKVTDCFVCLG